ncbi:hypothetical protein HJC23_012854 [Cyclotella cryptica]|uniref:Uncharacterized protein n=1 Tax=Cyclotella cryptica TaxID=29204 RepID=A0ABD3Q295_9STRA
MVHCLLLAIGHRRSHDMGGLSSTYNLFHSFWNDNLGIPEMTIHYERMTSKKDVSAAIQSVLTFLVENDLGYDIDYMTTLLDKRLEQVMEMVKEPEYEQGTVLARICGTKAAKIVHTETRENAEALGYVFDDKTGHWSLST